MANSKRRFALWYLPVAVNVLVGLLRPSDWGDCFQMNDFCQMKACTEAIRFLFLGTCASGMLVG